MLTHHDFEDAFEEHRNSIYRFAWRMTNSATAAEDILQDVFLAALRDRDRFKMDRGSLRSFLLGIARNLALKRFRNESRWVSWDDDLVCSYLPPTDMEDATALAAAVQELPPSQREALVLTTYEDLSVGEVARLIGVEVPVIKARLYRARENLKRMLAPLKPSLSGSSNGTSKR